MDWSIDWLIDCVISSLNPPPSPDFESFGVKTFLSTCRVQSKRFPTGNAFYCTQDVERGIFTPKIPQKLKISIDWLIVSFYCFSTSAPSEPKIRILKRNPAASAAISAPAAPAPPTKTYEERVQAYNEARKRILGSIDDEVERYVYHGNLEHDNNRFWQCWCQNAPLDVLSTVKIVSGQKSNNSRSCAGFCFRSINQSTEVPMHMGKSVLDWLIDWLTFSSLTNDDVHRFRTMNECDFFLSL